MRDREQAQIAAAPGNGAGRGAAGWQAMPSRSLDEREVALLRATLMSPRDREATDEEVALFCRQIERTGLDPFARQIYVVYRYNRRRRREEVSIEATIDGLRLIAERTGRYEGQTRVYWCGEDGKWRESWPQAEPPVAATVGVHKSGAREPTWGTAHFREYAEFWEDSGRAKGFYETMPRNQLAIRAEALALRKAFPAELSGLYAAEELSREEVEASAGEEAPGSSTDSEGSEEDGQGMRAVAARRPASAPAQLRRELRERIARAELGDEVAAKLADFYFDEQRIERLGEEAVREFCELVEGVGTGGIAAAPLQDQVAKAEGEADRGRARAAITRWILHCANEAAANGERPRAASRAASEPKAPGEDRERAA